MGEIYLPVGGPIVTTTQRATDPMMAWMRQITKVVPSGGAAPADAEYIVGALNGTLTNERLVTDTATITWDLATPGQAKANAVNEVPMHYATRALTNDEIKALPTTYLDLTTAPGSGKTQIPLLGWLQILTPGGAYTNISTGSQKGFAVTWQNLVDGTNYYNVWDGNTLRIFLSMIIEVPDAAALLAAYPGAQNTQASGADNTPLSIFCWNDAGNFTGGHASNTGRAGVIYTTLTHSTGALS